MKMMEIARSQRAAIRGNLIQNASAPIFNPINGEASKNMMMQENSYGNSSALPVSRLNLRDSQNNSGD